MYLFYCYFSIHKCRKYISGNPKAMQMEQQCQRIYIDVLTSHTSTSPEYNFHPDAIICCNNSNSSTSLPWWKIFSSYEHGLCSREVSSFAVCKNAFKIYIDKYIRYALIFNLPPPSSFLYYIYNIVEIIALCQIFYKISRFLVIVHHSSIM